MMTKRAILPLLLALAAGPALAQSDPRLPGTGSSPDAVFRQLDRNADGRLSRDEVRDPSLYDQGDRDNDGVLDRSESNYLLRSEQAEEAQAADPRRGGAPAEPPPMPRAKPLPEEPRPPASP
ncbi:MAG: hypothetical protein HXY25_12470 [Alphaproteobacteria bacterium]|nr:hypothetical protein [Alphaproteobacteria bacterium]